MSGRGSGLSCQDEITESTGEVTGCGYPPRRGLPISVTSEAKERPYAPAHRREAVHPGRRDVFTLQKRLGHTTLVMVRRYVELADVDVKAQHQRFSPADSLLRRPAPGRLAAHRVEA